MDSLDVCDRTLTYVDCLMKKPKPLLLYHGSRKSSVKHAQLRMKCSKHLILIYFYYMLLTLQRVLAGTESLCITMSFVFSS